MLLSGPLSLSDLEAVEVGVGSSCNRPARSNPVNMPMPGGGRSAVPVLIESGSCSKLLWRPHSPCLLTDFCFLFFPSHLAGSYEHSPRLLNNHFRTTEDMGSDLSISTGDSQLREDLADAMRESPGRHSRDSTGEFFPLVYCILFPAKLSHNYLLNRSSC